MPIHFMRNVACCKELCTVEEAEPLLQWLQGQPRGKVSLKDCTHLHTAVLQVLLAAGVTVTLPPENPELARWLMPALRRARRPSRPAETESNTESNNGDLAKGDPR